MRAHAWTVCPRTASVNRLLASVVLPMPLAQALDSVPEDVVVFSYGGCPYCRKLEQVLKKEGIAFAVLDYDADLGAFIDARSKPRYGLSGTRPPTANVPVVLSGRVTTASPPHTAASPGVVL